MNSNKFIKDENYGYLVANLIIVEKKLKEIKKKKLFSKTLWDFQHEPNVQSF